MAKRWYYKDANGNKVPVPQYKINADDYYTKAMSDSRYYEKSATDTLLGDKVSKSDIVQSTGTSTTAVMSQNAVSDIVNELESQVNKLKNAGYLYAGIATPTTNPGTPDGSVFYIANGKGTYTNFGGIDVTDDEVVILYYDTSWHKETTGIASNDKLTELDEKIMGISYSEEKTFKSASSILYFSGLNLHSGDKIYVKISGTALWLRAWLYGDAGTIVAAKILMVNQNNTYEITLTSDTNTIGLRIYELSSAGDVRIDLTKKKGELDHLYDYTDLKTEGLEIVGLDKGYEVISWDVLIADKEISAQRLHPQTCAGYNLIKLHCKAGDLLRITNISASIDTVVLSICSSDFIGNNYETVVPIIISQQNSATNYDWEAPFDCDIVICYYTLTTPVITKFSNPLVERVAVAENLSWQGKTVVCFGDSLTEFSGNGQGYGDWIAKFTGANVICVGIGGGQLSQRTTPVDNPANVNAAYAALDIYNMVKSSCEQDFTKQIAAANWLRDNAGDDNTAIIQRLVDIDWSKVDAVTILGGTNDWHNAGGFFGESGSTDANYTLGAINEIIRLLTSTYKHISLYWFTTIVRYHTPSGTSNIDARVHENWSDVWQNSAGMTLKDTIQPIIAEVSNNKIPICDMYNTLGWNENNFSQYFNIDNTHPYNGFVQMAKKMIGFINANRTF